jgi:endonuclease-3 related protein
MGKTLLAIYRRLLEAYGPQHWWPGTGPFEIVVGAILTQAVAWSNVEKAIAHLKRAGLLDSKRLSEVSVGKIAALIRPCIYYNEKARKLQAFVQFLEECYQGDLLSFFGLPVSELRAQLLSVRGIGEETADAIILYAAGKPSFVVDAYTRRILQRLGLIEERATYGEIRALFMDHLPAEVSLYNEYHALFVRHARERCRRSRPVCEGCCLGDLCPFPGVKRGHDDDPV